MRQFEDKHKEKDFIDRRKKNQLKQGRVRDKSAINRKNQQREYEAERQLRDYYNSDED